MIEILIGLVLVAAGVGTASGLPAYFLGTTAFDLGALTVVAGSLTAALGIILVAHGLFRRVRDRRPDAAVRLRESGTAWTALLTALVSAAVFVSVFGHVTVSGVPIGFAVVAVGLPVLLFALLLMANRKQSGLDAEDLDRRRERARDVPSEPGTHELHV
jgi:hydrogenase-4 membrane subunit HyfE